MLAYFQIFLLLCKVHLWFLSWYYPLVHRSFSSSVCKDWLQREGWPYSMHIRGNLSLFLKLLCGRYFIWLGFTRQDYVTLTLVILMSEVCCHFYLLALWVILKLDSFDVFYNFLWYSTNYIVWQREKDECDYEDKRILIMITTYQEMQRKRGKIKEQI